MNNPSNETEFHQQVSKPGVWFIVLASGAIGLIFLLGGFSRFPNPGPDAVLLLALGAGLLFLSWRIHRFCFRPRIRLTEREIVVNRFFSPKQFRWDDLTGFAHYIEFRKSYSRPARRTIEVRIPRLVLRLRNGREADFPMPRFGSNEELIQAVERRSGLTAERLPTVRKTF